MLYTSSDLSMHAWVENLADGQLLNEHKPSSSKDAVRGDDYMSCESYLEVQEGQSFRIRLGSPPCFLLRQPGLAAYLYIDGRYIDGKIWTRLDSEIVFDQMYIKEDGQLYAAELTFATLPTTGDETEVQIKGAALKDLCRIEVKVYRGVQQPWSKDEVALEGTEDIGKIYETDLKLGSTVVAGSRSDVSPRMTSDFIMDAKRPDVCTFTWTYHTRDKLVIMGIINDPSHPAPLPALSRSARKRKGKQEAKAQLLATAPTEETDDDIMIVERKAKKPKPAFVVKEDEPVKEEAEVSGSEPQLRATVEAGAVNAVDAQPIVAPIPRLEVSGKENDAGFKVKEENIARAVMPGVSDKGDNTEFEVKQENIFRATQDSKVLHELMKQHDPNQVYGPFGSKRSGRRKEVVIDLTGED